MARIYRDAYGVPHIRATDVLDLAHGQGWATARDRSWQLEYQRRRATGTAAEVLGRAPARVGHLGAADRDRRHRPAGLRRAGRGDPRLRHGVRRGGQRRARPQRPRARPARRSSPTVGAVDAARDLPRPADPLRQRARQAVAPPRARGARRRRGAAVPRPGLRLGQQRLGGRRGRTASGKPLIAGDPHRTFESPGVYAQVRLSVEGELDVFGFTFPGVPGVQHFAHAGDVAWAITNACADYQDICEESLDDVVDGRQETIEVRGADPVTVEVLATERGPLFLVDRDRGRGLAVRDAPTVLGDLGFDALLPLLRARTVDDVDRALDAWVVPVNNVVIADRAARSGSGTPAGCRPCRRQPARHRARSRCRHVVGLGRAAAPRRTARRSGGHRQRAARQRERPARHRVRLAAPGGPDPRAAAGPRTT